MKYIYKKITLDVHNMTSQLSLSVKQGATLRGIIVTLVDNGKIYEIPQDCYAVFSARKSDNTFVSDGCIIQNNKIIYNFSEQLVATTGKAACDIAVYGANNGLITSPLFSVFVYETVRSEFSSDVVSSDSFKFLTDLISNTTEAISNANNATAEANAAAEEARNSGNAAVEKANEAIATANEANEIARGHLHHIQTTADGKMQILDADMNVITTIDTFCGDDDTLHRYVDGMLSVIGIKERNKDNTYRVWVGTHDEYVALPEIDPTTFYWVTDDNTYEALVETINTLINDHNGLVEAHNILEEAHDSLEGIVNGLDDIAAGLSQKYNTLEGKHNSLAANHNTLQSGLQSGDFKVKKAEECDYSPYYIDCTDTDMDIAIEAMIDSFSFDVNDSGSLSTEARAIYDLLTGCLTAFLSEKPAYIRIKTWETVLQKYVYMVIPVATKVIFKRETDRMGYKSTEIQTLFVDLVWYSTDYRIYISQYKYQWFMSGADVTYSISNSAGDTGSGTIVTTAG